MTNPCTSTCSYSIALYYNGNTYASNSISLYINRAAVFQNISLGNTETTKTLNFNVVKGDLIQIPFYFNYQGGSNPSTLGYGYRVYNLPSLQGTQLYNFAIASTGPPSPANIISYCGKTLSLSLTGPSNLNVNGGDLIPFAVVPSVINNNPIQIALILTCGALSSTQYRLSSVNSTDTVNFPVPNSLAGACTIVAKSVDLLVPGFADSSALHVFITYTTSFTTPTTYGVQYGLPISVLVATTYNGTQALSVSLNCSNSVVIDTFTVNPNVAYRYNPPSSAFGSCSFILIPSIAGINSSSVLFPINGTIAITAPTPQSTIAAGSTTQVSLSYIPVPSSYSSSNLTLTCNPYQNITQVVTGSTMNLVVPTSFYGSNCVFSVSTPYYNLNNTVTTTVSQTSTFLSPTNNSITTIPNYIPVRISTTSSSLSKIITLSLTCGSAVNLFNVTTNLPMNYNSYSSNSYGLCSLAV